MALSERQKDVLSLLAIFASLIFYYPNLFLAKAGAIAGDHWVQHYPWAHFMADSIRSGSLPFWTPDILCGFPLAAESQIGLYYLPNVLLYLSIPFTWAYSYSTLLHFLISGAGTYLYCRQIKMNAFGAFLAAFVFLFGTAYGGAYYNITSLKTISWLPWALLLSERIFASVKWRWGILLALVIGMSMVAGYLQVAALTWLFFLVAVGIRFLLFWGESNKPELLKGVAIHAASGIGALLITLPQLLLTYDLALRSNRINPEEAFAYIGSLSPFALITLLNPSPQMLFRGNSLFIGTLCVFFLLAAIFYKKGSEKKYVFLWLSLSLLALFLALGRWSPLYVAIIKITNFYSFRVPAKFLVFICFGLSILSGYGAGALWNRAQNAEGLKLAKKSARWSAGIFIFYGTAAAMVFLAFTLGRERLYSIGKQLVETFIYGKAGHPHSYEHYLEKLDGYLDAVLTLYDPTLWKNIWPLMMVLSCFGLMILLLRAKQFGRKWLVLCMGLIWIDLYSVSFLDIKRDFGRYDEFMQMPEAVQTLLAEKEKGFVNRLYTRKQSAQETLPFEASTNMLYDIETIGGYSPLVPGRLHELIGPFGGVDDSNVQHYPEESFILERMPVLHSLGVSHILSSSPIQNWQLETLLTQEDGLSLYRVVGDHQKAYFLREYKVSEDWESLKETYLSPGFDPRLMLLLEKSEYEKLKNFSGKKLEHMPYDIQQLASRSGKETWMVNSEGPGFFVVQNAYDSGWSATLNGTEATIVKAFGVFQAVFIPEAGKYEVLFEYQPALLRQLGA